MREPERRRRRSTAHAALNPTVLALLAGVVVLLAADRLFRHQPKSRPGQADGNHSRRRAASGIGREAVRRAKRPTTSSSANCSAAPHRCAGAIRRPTISSRAYAVLRMENPVMESERQRYGRRQLLRLTFSRPTAGSCGRWRPPDVELRTSITRSSRQPTGAGLVVLLRNADAIITPLATLARVAQPATPTDRHTDECNNVGRSHRPVRTAASAVARSAGCTSSSGRQRQLRLRQGEDAGRNRGMLRRGSGRPRSQHGRAIWRAPWLRRHPSNGSSCFETRDRFLALSRPLPDNRMHRRRLCRAGCARSATSWKAAGSHRDNAWISSAELASQLHQAHPIVPP